MSTPSPGPDRVPQLDGTRADVLAGCSVLALLRRITRRLRTGHTLLEVAEAACHGATGRTLTLLHLHDALARLGIESIAARDAQAMLHGEHPVVAQVEHAGEQRFVWHEPVRQGRRRVYCAEEGWLPDARVDALACSGVILLPIAPPPRAAAARHAARQRALRQRHALLAGMQVIDGVIPDELCAALRDAAEPRMQRSRVADPGGRGVVSTTRTSSTAMGFADTELDRRVHAHVRRLIPPGQWHFESLQCVRYGVHEEFRPHVDTGYGEVQLGAQARYWTLLLYLNDDLEGGETMFPLLRRAVRPRRGRVLLFPNRLADGGVNLWSLHGGCPVAEGNKWVANLWFGRAQ